MSNAGRENRLQNELQSAFEADEYITLPSDFGPHYYAGILVQAGRIPISPLNENSEIQLAKLSDVGQAEIEFEGHPRSADIKISGTRTSIEIQPGQSYSQKFVMPADNVSALELRLSRPAESQSIALSISTGEKTINLEALIRGARIRGKFPLNRRAAGGKHCELKIRNTSSDPLQFLAFNNAGYPSLSSEALFIQFRDTENFRGLRRKLNRAILLIRRGEYRTVFNIVRGKMSIWRMLRADPR